MKLYTLDGETGKTVEFIGGNKLWTDKMLYSYHREKEVGPFKVISTFLGISINGYGTDLFQVSIIDIRTTEIILNNKTTESIISTFYATYEEAEAAYAKGVEAANNVTTLINCSVPEICVKLLASYVKSISVYDNNNLNAKSLNDLLRN